MTTLYRAYDTAGRLLYVGIAKDVFDRVGQHRTSAWSRHATRLEFIEYPTRDDAAAAELEAIRTEDPVWNIMGRPHERHLRWMAAYPDMDPDGVEVDAVRASLTSRGGGAK